MDDQSAHSQEVDQLAQEFIERYRRGESPKVSEYATQYPQHAEQILDLFPTLLMMEGIAPGKDSESIHSRTEFEEPSFETLGDYRILREIGRGGMGIVYEAEQISLGRRVALKILKHQALIDPRQMLRFKREAKAAAKLHHTNIVPVFGVGEHDGIDYYVMQFIPGLGLDEVLSELRRFDDEGALSAGQIGANLSVDGVDSSPASQIAMKLVDGSLGAAVELGGPDGVTSARETTVDSVSRIPDPGSSKTSVVLPGQSSSSRSKSNYWQSVARIGVQVGEALQYAHRQGVIHRDIKPANLLLDSNGTVWITDFGLAKADDQHDLTHTGDVLGTLRYMAPEMLSGKAEERSDVYALGLTLYELLTLRPAFEKVGRHDLIQMLASGTPTPIRKLNPSVPIDLETITDKAIDPDARHRYQTAGELAEDLQRFLNDEPIAARPINAMGRMWRWCKRSPRVAALSGTVLALLVTLAIGGPLMAIWNGSLAEEAQSQARRADRARDDATQSEAQTRRYLYVAHMNMVQQAWENSDLSRARGLLNRYSPHADEDDLRGFEWHYWWRLLSAQDLRAPLYHDDVVWCVDFSPDGKLMASASRDKTVKLWDAASSQPVRILRGHTDDVLHVAFSPDGKSLASASWDKTVKLWSVKTGDEIRTLSGYEYGVRRLAFSPTGDRLATAGGETLRLWNPTSGASAYNIDVGSLVECVAYSPDGSTLASGNRESEVDLWEASTGEHKLKLKGHHAKVIAVAFSADGTMLATADARSEIKVWDTSTNKQKLSMRGHKFYVTSVSFSPDGTTLASASTDNTVKLWDLTTGSEMTTIKGHDYLVNSVDFSPDGQLLASASDDRTVRLWDIGLGNAECSTIEGHEGTVWCVAVSTDGTMLVSGGNDGTVRLWNVATGEETKTLGRHQSGVFSVALSQDGQRLASSDRDGIVKVWDLANLREEVTLPKPSRKPIMFPPGKPLAFSPDGKTLADGEGTGAVRLWDTNKWVATEIPTAHESDVLSIAFSPDGKTLVTGGLDEVVKLWDYPTGREKRAFVSAGVVYAVAFSPDGKQLASSHALRNNETIRLWDVNHGTETHTLQGHTWVVNSLAFSPDGMSLASASWDFTVKLWNVKTGESTSTLKHTNHARWVVFTPDGQTLVSSGDDMIRLWNARSDTNR